MTSVCKEYVSRPKISAFLPNLLTQISAYPEEFVAIFGQTLLKSNPCFVYKGNNKITKHRAILQRERQNSYN